MTASSDRTDFASLTPLAALEQAAECLKILAHAHRLRMVQMLLRGRYRVGELAEACGIPSHMTSEHLRLMQRCGFLGSEKEGRKVYYTILEPHLAGILKCVESRFGSAAAAPPERIGNDGGRRTTDGEGSISSKEKP